MTDTTKMSRRAFLASSCAGLLTGCGFDVRNQNTGLGNNPPFRLERYDPDTLYRTPEPQPFEYDQYQPDPVIEQPQQFDRQGPTPTSRYVSYNGPASVGSVIINRATRKVYFVDSYGSAIEYNIAVGAEGTGVLDSSYTIQSKRVNPDWRPPADMRERKPSLPEFVEGGTPENPLGSRALYLYDANGNDTLLRIHGTNEPSSIGQAVSSGCFRMLNRDVEDLYRRVSTPASVIAYDSLSYTPGVGQSNQAATAFTPL